MVPPVEFRLSIDAYTRSTIPMERLAQSLIDWAKLLGETQSVHFDRIENGSVLPIAWVAWEAAPKVRRRLSDVRANEGPEEAKQARRRIDQLLVEDNASGSVAEIVKDQKAKTLLYFPGAKATAEMDYGPFRQAGTLTGVPIVIGGENDPVSVHIQDRDVVYNCRANRDIAKDIAPYLFTTPIRVTGNGTWFRSRDGEWEMRRFTIQGFSVLRHETVAGAAERLQNLKTKLKTMRDPIGRLRVIQRGDRKARRR